MILTHTISGSEAQQTIQKLQGINAALHFISYQVNGTSVVASPNQQYRNDKIGQIEGSLKFFVNAIIFKDSIMGKFGEYYADLVNIYQICENFYKYWSNNLASIIQTAERTQSEAQRILKEIREKENKKIIAVDYNHHLGLQAQAFIDETAAMRYFADIKKQTVEASSQKAQAIFEQEYGSANIKLMKDQQQKLPSQFKGQLAALKVTHTQQNAKMTQINKIVNDISTRMQTIFSGEPNQNIQLILLENARKIIDVYDQVGSFKIKVIQFLQDIQQIPWKIDHNKRLQKIHIELEVAKTLLPFLQAELNCLNEIYFGERLELGRLRMKDVIESIQKNLEVTKQNLKNLQKGFEQLQLAVNYDRQTFVSSITMDHIFTTTFTYVSGVTLSRVVPEIKDFNPEDVQFSEKTMAQQGKVKSLKERVDQLKHEIEEIQRLEEKLLKMKQEPAEQAQKEQQELDDQHQFIVSTKQIFTQLLQVLDIADVNQLNIKQVTALLGIILTHINIEKEACCGGKYDITKYTEVSKSYCDIVFAQAIRQVKNQSNSMCTTHSDRIKQTDSIKLVDAAKLVAQFELFGAYKTTNQDRQIISNSIRTMDIDNTLIQIITKIAQLFVQEYLISIEFSTLEDNSFIKLYKQQYIKPQTIPAPQQM